MRDERSHRFLGRSSETAEMLRRVAAPARTGPGTRSRGPAASRLGREQVSGPGPCSGWGSVRWASGSTALGGGVRSRRRCCGLRRSDRGRRRACRGVGRRCRRRARGGVGRRGNSRGRGRHCRCGFGAGSSCARGAVRRADCHASGEDCRGSDSGCPRHAPSPTSRVRTTPTCGPAGCRGLRRIAWGLADCVHAIMIEHFPGTFLRTDSVLAPTSPMPALPALAVTSACRDARNGSGGRRSAP